MENNVLEILEMINVKKNKTLTFVVSDLMERFVLLLNPDIYQLYIANSIDKSIDYLVQNMENKKNDDTDDEVPLIAVSNVIKIKILTFKHKLNSMNDDDTKKLIDIYSKCNLSDCNSFKGTLTTLLSLIPSHSKMNGEHIAINCYMIYYN